MTFAHLSPVLDDKPPTPEVPQGGDVFSWGNDCLTLHIHGEHIAPRLLATEHTQIPLGDVEELRRSCLPIVEIALAGQRASWNGRQEARRRGR